MHTWCDADVAFIAQRQGKQTGESGAVMKSDIGALLVHTLVV